MAIPHLIAVLLLSLLTVAPVPTISSPPPTVYDRYLEARTGAMQAAATASDIDRLGTLLADEIVYEHPVAGARIVGRAQVLDLMKQHLGDTRTARSRVLRRIDSPSAVAIEEELTFEMNVAATWKVIRRTQVLFLESKDGRLTRVIEYWK